MSTGYAGLARQLTWGAALFCLSCWCAAGAANAECLASFRKITFPDGSARVKNYICRTDGAAKPQLRVEFNRLSEFAAGSLIQGTPYPDLERVFGHVRVVKNAITAEAKRLFDKYGTRAVAECFAFLVSTAAGGQGYDAQEACGEQRTMWSFASPLSDAINMPLVSDIQHFGNIATWPRGYNFVYGDNCDVLVGSGKSVFDPISCTTLWRSARAQDVENYVQDMIAYDRLLGVEPGGVLVRRYNKTLQYFALVNDLAGGSWPKGFLVIKGGYEACGGGAAFSLPIRRLILDVAFIQNISDASLEIEGLFGVRALNTKLRIARSRDFGRETQRISFADGQLEPGETVAVPLGMSFVMDSVGNQIVADKVYRRIRATKPGTVFKTYGSVRKVRESFALPKIFESSPFSYGAALRLAGLVVNDKPIVFDQASRNFMKLSAFSPVGSCPYLYSWHDGLKTWVHHGKVIHAARGKEKQMTELRTFDGFRAKFRIAEEELEVSYIDSVALEIELQDGGGMTLLPNFDSIIAKDGRYAVIKAGDEIEFSFTLPPPFSASDVKRSTLAVTGYYRRYSDPLMATAR